jgi:hypothetical protein
MSEPFFERLSRFTPDAGGLDRDALLFLAGRASAPSRRLWLVLTAVLALSQIATLILLWPHEPPPTPGLPAVPRAVVPEPTRQSQEDNSTVISLQRRLLDSNNNDLPPPVGSENLAPTTQLGGRLSTTSSLLD